MAKENSEPTAKDLKFVKELMVLLEDSSLTEIDFQKGDLGISLSKSGPSSSGAVKSPMVGTAYTRPSPDAETFVNVGDKVKEGDTIMLIEAMKTFNPIVAPKSGKIEQVLVDDASAVEFGEALFIIV